MTPEEKQLETEWQRLLYKLKPRFKRKPNLQNLLFLIGLQEHGEVHRAFSKEEKQDLMHIATCTLLQQEGYFHLLGRDEDGWPHFEPTGRKMPEGLDAQEKVLKHQILIYFQHLWDEHLVH